MERLVPQLSLYLGILCSLLLAQPVFAAELQPHLPADMQPGSTIVVPIILDSKGETINAVEGFLHHSASLSLTEIRDGNSVVSFWVERPLIENGLIETTFVRFSGIMPGGFTGSGELFSLVFTVVDTNVPVLSLKAARALRNDGEGSETTLTMGKPSVLTEGTLGIDATHIDTTPPDTFVPVVSSDPNLYDGKQVVVFAAQDKGSGIDYYEVAEREGFGMLFTGALVYTRAVSPYVLHDQDLRSYIYVKAVDRMGNERVVRVSPEQLPMYYNVDLLALILGALLLLTLFGWTYAKRITKS